MICLGVKKVEAVAHAITEGVRPEIPDAPGSLGFTRQLWRIIQWYWLVEVSTRPDVRTILAHLNHTTWSWERQLVGVNEPVSIRVGVSLGIVER